MAQALTLPQDQTVVEHDFTRGIVKDTDDIPAGGLYQAFDWLVHERGVLMKRGGWTRHSQALGGTRMNWVGALNVPPRLAAIDSNGTLWDATNAGAATSVASVGFAPAEHSSQYVNMVILCDPASAILPKKVFFSSGLGTLDVAQWGGVDAVPAPDPLTYAYSTVYSGRVVLGRGTSPNNLQRIHFSELPDVEAPWDPLKYIDTSYDITGLSTIGGVLLIFSAQHVERILGGVPPAEEGSDMQLQPVAGVGCLDARSIVTWDNNVIFAGEEGVWTTNGSGVDSLIEKPDETGIQSYWSHMFPRGQKRQIVAGLFNRDFYLVHIVSDVGDPVATFMCHLPQRSWTMLTNIKSTSMTQARTSLGVLELYSASSADPYVDRYSEILTPYAGKDGDGTIITPSLLTRRLDGDSPSLKAYGFGRITYTIDIDGFDAWLPNHPYTLYSLICEGNHVYRVTTAGTSGPNRPVFGRGLRCDHERRHRGVDVRRSAALSPAVRRDRQGALQSCH